MSNETTASSWQRTVPFRVDVAGVIHIMGSALYSRPATALRELIQNAHDAIMRRRKSDLEYSGRIDIVQLPEQGILEIHDDGIGLSAEEAEAYLGTLGIGITGLLKGTHPSAEDSTARESGLIGQFGIGLFSAFMLADEIEVISRRAGQESAVRWRAGAGTDIQLASAQRDSVGTTVRLVLQSGQQAWAQSPELIEEAVKRYADFLPIPIYLNHGKARVNVVQSQWFDPSPDAELLEQELAAYFDESPLDVIPIHTRHPVEIAGALYVSPQRTPGFSGDSDVTVTVMRMVISHGVADLVPPWASFLRGLLEVSSCRPTASREDLVRDENFEQTRIAIETKVFEQLERIAIEDPVRFESILQWHRYTLAGSALFVPRLRALLAKHYRFATSQGDWTIAQILQRSKACPIRDAELDFVVWYQSDRRQEKWLNGLFSQQDTPCVYPVRSFEEALLASILGDVAESQSVELRLAHPSSKHFAEIIAAARNVEPAPGSWSTFLGAADARIMTAEFRSELPVMAFLNERHSLLQTFDELKKQGTVPSGFQRIIDRQLGSKEDVRNEVMLNRNHRLVARALQQSTGSPIASVLRLLVLQALSAAGATLPREAMELQVDDLDWIADALWGKNSS